MRFGVHLPQWGPDATRDGVLAVARAAEAAGLDSVWVADHVVHPHRTESVYPYRGDGVPFAPEEGFLDAFTTLALVAGATEKVRLGTSIFVLPMRGPLEVAGVVATLDVLSAGRVILGVGAGWWKEEFDALGASFAGRGKRMDEQIEIIRALWRDGTLEHHGDHYDFAELTCRPLPVQPGGPPIWIGGMGPTGWRRAARIGDDWHAVGSHPETLAAGYAEVREIAAADGRDPDEIGFSTSVGLPDDNEKAIDRFTRLGKAGVDHAVMNIRPMPIPETCERIASFGREALPAIRHGLDA